MPQRGDVRFDADRDRLKDGGLVLYPSISRIFGQSRLRIEPRLLNVHLGRTHGPVPRLSHAPHDALDRR
jgi:hypothetical protein